jgi:glutamyl-tRNA(Gln) amidotransferase subunit E
VKGIGSIRQDVNVSIPLGARVEIKGVQDLSLMPKFIENEISRQENLIKIRQELKKNKVKLNDYKDVSKVFSNTACNFLKNQTIYGFKLSNASGILGTKIQKDKTFGKEIAEHLKVGLSINGLLHKDELPNYGVSINEVNSVIKALECKDKDNFILISTNSEKIISAEKIIMEFLKAISEEIIKEVRAPNHADATNSYLRPLPSGQRMYPETDVPVIRIQQEMIADIIANISKTPEEKYAWLKSTGLNDELSSQLLKSDKLSLYELIIDKTNADNTTAASIILMNPAEKIGKENLILLFKLLEEEKICKESLPLIIERMLKKENIKSLIAEYKQLSPKELKLKIRAIIDNNKELLKNENAFGILMKKALEQLRGKADAGLISKVVKQELRIND